MKIFANTMVNEQYIVKVESIFLKKYEKKDLGEAIGCYGIFVKDNFGEKICIKSFQIEGSEYENLEPFIEKLMVLLNKKFLENENITNFKEFIRDNYEMSKGENTFL